MKKRISLFLCFCILFAVFFCNVESQAIYITLDNKRITTFVRAEFTGETTQIGYDVYIKFKVNEVYFGVAEEEIWFHDLSGNYYTEIKKKKKTDKRNICAPSGRSPYDHKYEAGTEYLLLASKIADVYYPFDYYEPKDGFFVEAKGLYGVASCYPAGYSEIWMKYYEPYMQGDPDALSDEEILRLFANQVVDYLKQNSEGKPFYGTECIRTDDFNEIEAKAPDILRVCVKNKGSENKYLGIESRECEVLEVLRGDCKESEIHVSFFKNDVKYNGEYIIYAIERVGRTDVYELYAPHAVKTVKEPSYAGFIIIISSIVAVILITIVVVLFLNRKAAAKNAVKIIQH